MPDHINKNYRSHDWCQIIGRRCAIIDTEIASFVGQDADGYCLDLSGVRLDELCNIHFSCHSLYRECRSDPPILTPRKELSGKTGEGAPYHDLPAFKEVAYELLRLLPKPTRGKKDVTILYPASGSHLAPLELAFHILNDSNYRRVHLIFSEIREEYVLQIKKELKKLYLEEDLTHVPYHSVRNVGSGYREHSFRFDHMTRENEMKRVELTVVIGKVEGEKYPPYFRQSDYARADIVVLFDTNDETGILRDLNRSRKESLREDQGKIFMMENLPEYSQWAIENSSEIYKYFSQEYGCEVKKGQKPRVPGLRPILFRVW